MWQDKVNSCLLGLSAILLVLNVRRLYRDKSVSGVSIWPVVLYDVWGFWDLYYFPSLHQWFSMGASFIACCTNAVWLFLAVYYMRRKPVQLDLEDIITHIQPTETPFIKSQLPCYGWSDEALEKYGS